VFSSVIELVDSIRSINDCADLAIHGLKVTSDVMASSIAAQLLEVGSSTFVVERTKSGVYIASDVTKAFQVDQINSLAGKALLGMLTPQPKNLDATAEAYYRLEMVRRLKTWWRFWEE